MGLMQEGLRRSVEIKNALPVNLNPSEIKASRLPAGEARSESRIPELLSLILGEKDKAEHAQKPKLKRQDGFEPFVNPEPSEDTLFVNGYNGNFAQTMELNRKGIERVLKIAHLDGQVFLTSLSPNRQRSIETNPDGSVSAKRFRFFGKKTEEDEKDNPLHRVISLPQGWRIEINDQKLTEELTEKNLSGEELQKAFVGGFNRILKKSLFECAVKEKFSSVKDSRFRKKLIVSAILLAWPPVSLSIQGINFLPLVIYMSLSLGLTGIINGFTNSHRVRKLDAPWEHFMPRVEIDKVARAWAFLSLKGRKLVKEIKPEVK